MRERLRARLESLLARARRIERREFAAFRVWLEDTQNLVHLSVLFFVPVVIAAVTELSNTLDVVPFVLFPPLASGTFTLFSDPEGRYASPLRFVAGLTAGASCGGVAFLASRALLGAPAPGTTVLGHVSPLAAAIAVFLTGGFTWAFDVEEPSAFPTALLALVAPASGGGSPLSTLGQYVVGVAAASVVVVAVFVAWRERFYERRAHYLYKSIKGDDHVLVPMRGTHEQATAMLGARLAAAHDAGKVVLLDVVRDEAIAAAEESLLAARRLTEDASTGGDARTAEPTANDGPHAGMEDSRADTVPPTGDTVAASTGPQPGAAVGSNADGSDAVDGAGLPPGPDESNLRAAAEERAAAQSAADLESRAERIEREVGVPCEVVVATGEDDPGTVIRTAREANCDLVVAPYEERDGGGDLSPFVRGLLRGDVDVLVHRSADGRTSWRRLLVSVSRKSDTAHNMIDFAIRLTDSAGVSVCHCIGDGGDRRRAERLLSDLVETFDERIETRVSGRSVEAFLADAAPAFDMVLVGASTDRSVASRFVSRPTFERISDLDTDVAILDRNVRY